MSWKWILSSTPWWAVPCAPISRGWRTRADWTRSLTTICSFGSGRSNTEFEAWQPRTLYGAVSILFANKKARHEAARKNARLRLLSDNFLISIEQSTHIWKQSPHFYRKVKFTAWHFQFNTQTLICKEKSAASCADSRMFNFEIASLLYYIIYYHKALGQIGQKVDFVGFSRKKFQKRLDFSKIV